MTNFSLEQIRSLAKSHPYESIAEKFGKELIRRIDTDPESHVIKDLSREALELKYTPLLEQFMEELSTTSPDKVASQNSELERDWIKRICLATVFGLGPLEILDDVSPPLLDIIVHGAEPILIRIDQKTMTPIAIPLRYPSESYVMRAMQKICVQNGWRIDQKFPLVQGKWRARTLDMMLPAHISGTENCRPLIRAYLREE